MGLGSHKQTNTHECGTDQPMTPGTKPWDLNPVHDWEMEMGPVKTSWVGKRIRRKL